MYTLWSDITGIQCSNCKHYAKLSYIQYCYVSSFVLFPYKGPQTALMHIWLCGSLYNVQMHDVGSSSPQDCLCSSNISTTEALSKHLKWARSSSAVRTHWLHAGSWPSVTSEIPHAAVSFMVLSLQWDSRVICVSVWSLLCLHECAQWQNMQNLEQMEIPGCVCIVDWSLSGADASPLGCSQHSCCALGTRAAALSQHPWRILCLLREREQRRWEETAVTSTLWKCQRVSFWAWRRRSKEERCFPQGLWVVLRC